MIDYHMRTIVIADLHNRVDWIEAFLKKQIYDFVIFLGDYFDEKGDHRAHAENTARWLKHSLSFKNRIHLRGNHDMAYEFPRNKFVDCPGNNWDKSQVINSILKKEDWRKLEFVTFHQGWTLSHAGLHPKVFSHPIHGMTDEWIKKCCKTAMICCEMGDYSPFLEQGSRMGSAFMGGCTWLDWYDFVPVKGRNQIFGHSAFIEPKSNHKRNSKNWNLDTFSYYYGVIENGKFSYHDSPVVRTVGYGVGV